MTDKDNQEWWNNQGGFFGSGYLIGDDSVEGYLPEKSETLEERTKREVDGVLKLLNPRENAWILDVPCGYGRHSIELAKRGYFVNGNDINEEFLKIAKETAKRELASLPAFRKPNFEKRDMRTLMLPEESFYLPNRQKLTHLKPEDSKWRNHFDGLINMFYSFGFFTDEENKETMQSFYDSLSEERHGKLLLHTDVSPEMINSGHYRLTEKRKLQNGGSLVIEEEYDERTKRINGLWRIEDGTDAKTLTPYSVRIYTREEFDEMARQAGFSKVDFYGSFNGERFTPESKEMIMVAEK